MQVDMNALIKEFFDSVRKYARSKVIAKYKDPVAIEELQEEYEGINAIEKAINKLANTKANERKSEEFKQLVVDIMYKPYKFGVERNIFVDPDLESEDEKYVVFYAFDTVVQKIGDYYSSGKVFGNDPREFLEALRKWKCARTRSVIKDVFYTMLPLSYFARVKNKEVQK